MNLKCPYCNEDISDPDECYEEGVTYDEVCPHCEKNFVFYVEYSRHYSAHQADCLNGREHDYKKTNTWPEKYAVMRCTMCGHEKQIEITK